MLGGLQMSNADWINAALVVAAVVAIAMTYSQLRSSARTGRASFLKDLYSTLTSDPDICRAYYLVEYGQFTYRTDFHGSELEPQIDRLLSFADLVCELHDQGIISLREMEFFKYRFMRLASDSNIRAYLDFLTEYYRTVGVQKEPFHSFAAYGRTIVKETPTYRAA